MTPVTSMSPLLILHIVSAVVAILSGAIVFALPKGTPRHRQIGTAFFGSMLAMASVGAYLALLEGKGTSVMAGVFTCYLVLTAWVAIRRRNGEVGAFEVAALAVGLAIALWDLASGYFALTSADPHRRADAMPYLIFGAVAAIAAGSDLKMILDGGLAGARRVTRHLWRMCMAMFIATTSLFLGQQKVFPAVFYGSPLMVAPVVLVLGLTIYWIVRARFAGAVTAARSANRSATRQPAALGER